MSSSAHIAYAKPRSQKAKGLQVLTQRAAGMEVSQDILPCSVVQEEPQAETAWAYFEEGGMWYPWYKGEKFARPCPKTPRPGFVDSRTVKNVKELKALLKETLEVEKEGEVLLTPFIPSKANAIVSPTSLVIGAGHDGATAGKNAWVTPLLPERKVGLYTNKTLLEKAGVAEGQEPHFEVVLPSAPLDGYAWAKITQLRGAPALPTTLDYVPEDVKVKKVVKLAMGHNAYFKECVVDVATGKEVDLLKWESTVKKFGEGTVVHHTGGALSCHIGLHCFMSGVPYVTTHEVKVGDKLDKAEGLPPPKVDLSAMQQGIRVGMALGRWEEGQALPQLSFPDIRSYLANATSYALFRLHNYAAEGDAYEIGLSAALLYRALCVLCFGEYRHRGAKVSGAAEHADNFKESGEREFFYDAHWYGVARASNNHSKGKVISHEDTYKTLSKVTSSYLKEWWANGYGGPNWGTCGVSAHLLREAMATVMLPKASAKDAKALLTEMNRAVNAAHNGGWVFNKFFLGEYEGANRFNGQNMMDAASNLKREFIMLAAFPALVKIREEREKVEADAPNPFVEKSKKVAMKWRDVIEPARVKIALDLQAGKITEAAARKKLELKTAQGVPVYQAVSKTPTTDHIECEVCLSCATCSECTCEDGPTVGGEAVLSGAKGKGKKKKEVKWCNVMRLQWVLKNEKTLHIQARFAGDEEGVEYRTLDMKLSSEQAEKLAEYQKAVLELKIGEDYRIQSMVLGSPVQYVLSSMQHYFDEEDGENPYKYRLRFYSTAKLGITSMPTDLFLGEVSKMKKIGEENSDSDE